MAITIDNSGVLRYIAYLNTYERVMSSRFLNIGKKIEAELKELMLKPTEYWSDKPTAKSWTMTKSGSGINLEIGCKVEGLAYTVINFGSPPHKIYSRGGPLRFIPHSQPKTHPGTLESRPAQGPVGLPVFVRYVNVEGIQPRRFDKTVEREINRMIPTILRNNFEPALIKFFDKDF